MNHRSMVTCQNMGRLANVANMEGMFYEASSLNSALSKWYFPFVTNVAWIFARASSLYDNSSLWDVSNVVVDTSSMFYGAPSEISGGLLAKSGRCLLPLWVECSPTVSHTHGMHRL